MTNLTFSPAAHPAEAKASHAPRVYKYYDLLMVAFVTVLICSEFISAGKVARIGSVESRRGGRVLPAELPFRRRSHRGLRLCQVAESDLGRLILLPGVRNRHGLGDPLPSRPPHLTGRYQNAWETVFSNSWRIVGASLTAFLVGEWVNSVVLAKMKIMTSGLHLWSRTIGSTVAGELVDSAIFYPLAFLNVWDTRQVVNVLLANYVLKVTTEVVLTPVTYQVVGFLKRAEHEDYYDIGTNFSPLPGHE